MSGQAIITTILGAFLLPFFIRLFWGRFVNKLGGFFGGLLAAISIVGTIWVLNHGMENHFIVQSGDFWIDMSCAAAIGLFVASVAAGGKIKKSLINVGAGVTGGIIAGIVLFFMM